jgi:hypothetical protein
LRSTRTRFASLSPMKIEPSASTKIPCSRFIAQASGSPSGPSPRMPVPATVDTVPSRNETLRIT